MSYSRAYLVSMQCPIDSSGAGKGEGVHRYEKSAARMGEGGKGGFSE